MAVSYTHLQAVQGELTVDVFHGSFPPQVFGIQPAFPHGGQRGADVGHILSLIHIYLVVETESSMTQLRDNGRVVWYVVHHVPHHAAVVPQLRHAGFRFDHQIDVYKRQDMPNIRAALASMRESGLYPEHLWRK